MTQQPRRIPGERNPQGSTDAPMHVARQSWMSSGHQGDGAPGIASAVAALFAWRKRRRLARKHR